MTAFVEVGLFRPGRWIVPSADFSLLGAAITTFPGLGRRAAIDRSILRGELGSSRARGILVRPLTPDADAVLQRGIAEAPATRWEGLVGTQRLSAGCPKIVAALLDAEGVPALFLKVVLGAEPARLCGLEGEALAALAPTTLSHSVPTLVSMSLGETFGVLVTEAVPGTQLQATAMPTAAVVELAAEIGTFRASHETVSEFAARAAPRAARGDGVGLANVFAAAAAGDGTAATLPLRFAHGDFVPWNMRAHGSSVVAVDWELCADRPPLWDICHFLVQPVAMGFVAPRQRPWPRVEAALRAAAPAAGVSPEDAADLGRLYLAYSLVDGVGTSKRAQAVRLGLFEASRW
jgi:hypothetical protein